MNKNMRAVRVLAILVVLVVSIFAILEYYQPVAKGSLIFADGFETNSLDAWDKSLAGPSGTLINTSSAKPNEGSYSAYAWVNGGANGQSAWVEKDFPDQSEIYVRSYIYFNSFDLPAPGDIVCFCRVKSSVSGTIAYAGIRNNSGIVKFFVYDAIAYVPSYGSAVATGRYYCLELHVKLGTGSNDGEVQLFVDGNSDIDLTGRNLTSLGNINAVRMGIPIATGAGPSIFPSCSLYVDSCIISTQYIGGSTAILTPNVATLPFQIRASTVLQNGTLLAVQAWTNQVYESFDGGQTWQLHSTLPRIANDQKAMYTTSMNTVLFADVLMNQPGQVYRFANGAWTIVLTLDINETIWNFQEANGIVYAGTYSENTESLGHAKLWASKDDGVTWSLLANFTGYRHIHEVFVNTNGYVYAALGDVPCALMRSTDNGSTWTNLNSKYLFTAITAFPNSNVIYLGGDSGPQIYSFYDNGSSTVFFSKIYDGTSDLEGAILWMARMGNLVLFGEYSTNSSQNVKVEISDGSWTTFGTLVKLVAPMAYYGFYYCTRSFWNLQNVVVSSPDDADAVLVSLAPARYYHVECVNHYDEPVSGINVSIGIEGYPEAAYTLTNGTGFANFENILNGTYRVIAYYKGVVVANLTDTVTVQDQVKTVELFQMGDAEAPAIGTPSNAPQPALPNESERVSVNVTDDVAGVHDVTLSYRLNTSQQWTNVTMAYNSTSMLYEASMQPQPAGTEMSYMITAHDNAGKQSVNDNQTLYFEYITVPEFPAIAIVVMFFFGTAPLLLLLKRRKNAR